jgi:hypothetical protein
VWSTLGRSCSRPCPLSSPGFPHAFRVFGGADLPLFPSVFIFLPLVFVLFFQLYLFFLWPRMRLLPYVRWCASAVFRVYPCYLGSPCSVGPGFVFPLFLATPCWVGLRNFFKLRSESGFLCDSFGGSCVLAHAVVAGRVYVRRFCRIYSRIFLIHIVFGMNHPFLSSFL